MCDRLLQRKSLSVWSVCSEQASVHSNSLIHISYLCCLWLSVPPSLLSHSPIIPSPHFPPLSSLHARLKQNGLFISRRWRKYNNQTDCNPKGGTQGRAALPEHPGYSNICPVMLHLQQLHTCSTCQLFSGSQTQRQAAHTFTDSTETHGRRINTNVHRRRNTHAYTDTRYDISWVALNLLLISSELCQRDWTDGWLLNAELPIPWTSVSHGIPVSFSSDIISCVNATVNRSNKNNRRASDFQVVLKRNNIRHFGRLPCHTMGNMSFQLATAFSIWQLSDLTDDLWHCCNNRLTNLYMFGITSRSTHVSLFGIILARNLSKFSTIIYYIIIVYSIAVYNIHYKILYYISDTIIVGNTGILEVSLTIFSLYHYNSWGAANETVHSWKTKFKDFSCQQFTPNWNN